MGLWATGMPIGSMSIFFIAPLLAGQGEWRRVWWFGFAYAVVVGLLFLLLMKLPPRLKTQNSPPRPLSLRAKRSNLLAAGGVQEHETGKIGFHKGALTTLAKEREEMSKILQIVEQLMQMHIKSLKDLGVDLEKAAKQAQGAAKTSKKKASGKIEDMIR